MKKYLLQKHIIIDGIGAASGIVYHDENLYIIGDSATFLYQYNLKSTILNKFELLDNASENIEKKDKPDFESITLRNNKLYIFGSGSTKNREIRVKFDLENQNTSSKEVSKLYKKFKKTASFSNDDLNLEGSFYLDEKLYMFNRGNSETAKNGIFIYDKSNKKVDFTTYNLPIINNVEATFTDAICFENKIYFLATAENTTSTYNDGEVYGSIIGQIDLQSLKLEKTIQITNNQKFEGLTVFSNENNKLIFLLCEDNDTELLQSTIYKLTIEKE